MIEMSRPGMIGKGRRACASVTAGCFDHDGTSILAREKKKRFLNRRRKQAALFLQQQANIISELCTPPYSRKCEQ